MSSITVKYHPDLETQLSPHKLALSEALIAATVITLSTESHSVIIDFQPWGTPAPTHAPGILIRGETSVRRRTLIKKWGEMLISTWQDTCRTHHLEGPFLARVAAKTYVLDSEWCETGDE